MRTGANEAPSHAWFAVLRLQDDGMAPASVTPMSLTKRACSTVLLGAGALLMGCYTDAAPDPGLEPGDPGADPIARETVAFSWNYDSWDTDRDGRLSEQEIASGMATVGYYDLWDRDDDGSLDIPELSRALVDAWDADADELLGDDELTTGWSSWLRHDWERDFDSYDTTGDGFLDDQELRDLLAELYRGWDRDGDDLLSRAELSAGLHTTLDDDDDGVVHLAEL